MRLIFISFPDHFYHHFDFEFGVVLHHLPRHIEEGRVGQGLGGFVLPIHSLPLGALPDPGTTLHFSLILIFVRPWQLLPTSNLFGTYF